MRLVTVLAAMIFAFIAATTSMHAQGRGQAKKTTVSAPKAKTQTPKQTTKADTRTAKAATKADRRAAKTAAKAETRAAKATAKADARAAKATAKADTRVTKAETKAARKSGTTTTDVTPTTPTTVKNAKLEARLATLLPGVNVQEASQGFKNWGQFMAAAHVSNNLGIPFADLKARMTGIAPGATEPTLAPMSLGQAIQSFKGTTPEADTTTKIRNEVKKAEDAANLDLRRSRDRS